MIAPIQPHRTAPASMAHRSPADRFCLLAASLAGFSAIAIGAFGAHGLPTLLESAGQDAELIARRMAQFDTGARYHLAHAVALLAMAGLPFRFVPVERSGLFLATAMLMLAGIVFFSGSLYLLVLTNTPWLGAITPIGGVCWLVAWGLLGWLCRSSKPGE